MLYISIPAMAGSNSGSLLKQGLQAENKGNYRVAAKFYKKACDSGDAKGCYNLGLSYEFARGNKQNKFKELRFFKKACEGGNAVGCRFMR